MNEILVVEDNNELREILKEGLESEDINVFTVESAEEALKILKSKLFDIVITDLKLPGMTGIELLESIKPKNQDVEFIVITAYGSIDTAVSAMKIGAVDFITKPFSIEHMRVLVRKVLDTKTIKEENKYLKTKIKRDIIGKSKKIKDVLKLVDKVALNDATVLIHGESGVGKELIAEEIHYKSKRKNYPLIKVNCASLSPGVLESELFGHEKGAFTDAYYLKKGRFELADKGTIFLDEIGDLPLDLQVKLLRVLQDKTFERVGGEKSIKVDVRIIAATNKNIKEMVKKGLFREDLFYRLNVVEINVPSLRERKEDIEDLVKYFIKKYAEYSSFKVKSISKSAIEVLKNYDYPGNIRELENIIQRILVLIDKEEITDNDIPYEIKKNVNLNIQKEGLDYMLEEYEKKIIIETLNKTKGNKQKAAEILKINRTTLLSRMKKYNIL